MSKLQPTQKWNRVTLNKFFIFQFSFILILILFQLNLHLQWYCKKQSLIKSEIPNLTELALTMENNGHVFMLRYCVFIVKSAQLYFEILQNVTKSYGIRKHLSNRRTFHYTLKVKTHHETTNHISSNKRRRRLFNFKALKKVLLISK